MTNLQGERIQIKYIPLSQVVLWDENPKDHDIGKITQSIKKHGFRDPLGFDSTLGALVEGHGRSHCLRMMEQAGDPPPRGIATDSDGNWYVPVLFGVDAESAAMAKAYAIDHNNLTMAGNFEVWDVAKIWDESAYTALLEEMGREDVFPVTVDGDDLDALLREFAEEPEPPDDPGAQVDRAEELNETWQVQPGDLWQIPSASVAGKAHRLLCGDSTKAEDVERLMGGEKANLVITSPPYPGANMWSKDGEDLIDQIKRLDDLNTVLLKVAYDCLQDDGVCMWNVADVPFGNHGMITTTTTTTTTACYEVGFIPRGAIIWDKGSPNLTPPSFMRRPCIPTMGHETILLLYKGDWKPREKKSGIPHEDKQWMAKSVWPIATESAKKIGHKAPFPVEIPRRCLSLWSLVGDTVFDLCIGSGTTAVAAERTGRICYGMEIEPKYCAVALERLAGLGLEPRKLINKVDI